MSASVRKRSDKEEDVRLFALLDVTLELGRGRVLPLVATPRSLDLVHLPTALFFHERERIDRFVTLDAAQATSARELGLPA